MPAVSVIVPARNAEATLARTLECLAAQEGAVDFEVIVVDNGSSDRTAEIADAGGPRVRRIQGPGDVAGARNAGLAASEGPLLAFTDADCFPEPGWLAAGVAALADAELVQGRVIPDPSAVPAPFMRTLTVAADAGLYETANLFARRDAVEGAGGFEGLLEHVAGRPFGEDTWMGWRARRAGARSVFCADAVVHHAAFARDARDYVAERARLEHFADLARHIPELRQTLFFARVFLSRRTAAFDVAVLAAALCAARRSPLPLALAAPYAFISARRALRWGRRAPQVAAVDLVADAAGLRALLKGSLRTGSPVL